MIFHEVLRLQTLLDSFMNGITDRQTYSAEKTKGMSHKKSSGDQSKALLKSRGGWQSNLILDCKKTVVSVVVHQSN